MNTSPPTDRGSTDMCPNCRAPDVHREEVDIGVGTMRGPASCENCGWKEPVPEAFDNDDDDWMLDPDMEDK